ncbi:hypothetical protein COLU111180_02820 [Cohnella lubricantis]|uniref:Uncharacterized protein n=1 Tax=Cohnella lubricantis TaxID=2163172 RepID=A0A841TBH2_9BACL|nr:hypothetical protein [Cohnella lubricantis]MBB6676367.1 hypothetical protein [Cohnella lubricantis]MBP2118789.1 hypothetical protein [Cohnella lubricantis]
MAEEQSQMVSREQIYNEVWELSLAGVARKYSISYSFIYKLCKEANVPIPPSGYWTKLNFGKPVSKPPLPDSTINEVAIPRVKTSRIRVQKIEKGMATISETKIEATQQDEAAVNNANASPDDALEAGLDTDALSLSKSSKTTKYIDNRSNSEADHNSFFERLAFLVGAERNKVLDIANQIQIPNEKARLHPKIAAHKNVVIEWNKNDKKEVGAQRSPQNYSSYRSRPPFLAGVISKETLPRVYRILGALNHAIERLGGSVTDSLTFIVRNESVSLEIYEMQDKVDHVITKSEENQLRKYEEDKKRYSWASKPNLRKYDYVFNGQLCININQNRNKRFRDTKSSILENQLGLLLIEMYDASEIIRKEREAREEERRKLEEAERLREERRKRHMIEVERTVALTNMAQDYAMACKIREYVSALESFRNLAEEDIQWIDWAKKKADWYDPIIAREDEILGKREHQKGKELKTGYL